MTSKSVRGFSVPDGFRKKITGNKKPDNRRLIITIVVSLVLFLLANAATFFEVKSIERALHQKEATAFLQPFLVDEGGKKYLPFVVANTGDVVLTGVAVHISTCEMRDAHGKYYEHYNIPFVQERQQVVLYFENPKTVEGFQMKACSASVGIDDRGMAFTVNPTDLRAQTVTGYVCGTCFYNVHIEADQGEWMYEDLEFPYPISTSVNISGGAHGNVPNSNITLYYLPLPEFHNYTSPFNDS